MFRRIAARRPREAIAFLTQADPESGWLRGWYPYWGDLTWAYHRLGDHKRELEAAGRARRQFPDHPAVRRYEILALGALGRIDEVIARIEEAQVLGPEGARTDLMWLAAWELRAHGYRAAGMQMLRRQIEWLESRPESEQRNSPATSLLLVGRLDEARVLYEEQFDGRPDNDLWKLADFAFLAAREGRREEVLRISRVVDSIPRPPRGHFTKNDTWVRITIAVARGDRERAMELLRGYGYASFLHRQYQLEPLWDYPPFQELIRPKG